MENKHPLISIILPSYNDKDIILPYYHAITNHLTFNQKYDWELIYVDDGSNDGSVEVLRDIALSDDSKVKFLELSRNFGQQRAFLCGLQHSKGDIVITLDGDFQYPAKVITQLADKIMEGYDIASGIRDNRCDPFIGRITSKIGQWFIKRTVAKDISDFGSVKGFSRYIVDGILQNEMFTVQIYGLAYKLTNRCCEISVEHLKRYSGESKWNFWMRLDMYLELYLLFGQVNLRMIFFISILMMLAGCLYFTATVISNLVFNFWIGSGVGSVVLVSTGCIILFINILLSIILKTYKAVSYKQFIIVRNIYKKDEDQ